MLLQLQININGKFARGPHFEDLCVFKFNIRLCLERQPYFNFATVFWNQTNTTQVSVVRPPSDQTYNKSSSFHNFHFGSEGGVFLGAPLLGLVGRGAVSLPVLVVELSEVIKVGDGLEVAGQLQQLAVVLPVLVSVAERTDFQPRLRVHQEVAPYVVEHDRVARRVLRVLAPNHAQRLHLRNFII